MSVSITFNQDLVALNSTQSPPSLHSLYILYPVSFICRTLIIFLSLRLLIVNGNRFCFRIGGGNGIGNENENENENVCSSMDFCLIINRQQKYK